MLNFTFVNVKYCFVLNTYYAGVNPIPIRIIHTVATLRCGYPTNVVILMAFSMDALFVFC